VAAAVPLERLVLETDCPYLAPHPHRGKTNQPGYLPLIAAEIARLRAIDADQLIAAYSENAKTLFNI
ncbi:MAG TPA: hydrolase TatD, partial [Firmicutes bacterium]|nr:hydrolase TatD [Bacillota bacterium]